MAVKRVREIPNINVYDAAVVRIKNVFSNSVPVILSMSGGKDSICLCSLVYELIEQGEVDPTQLTVEFIDEEAMFDCVIDVVKKWRKKFLAVGAKFNWYCIQVRHYNCLNSLTEDESFICWDEEKRDVWVREMPPFAITSHRMLRPRKDTYQKFMLRKSQDSITMIGLRGSESIQRQKNLNSLLAKRGLCRNQVYPIHDWTNKDVFKYIRDKGLEIPDVYQKMWESGVSVNNLRISQFFSIDTARSLVKLYEYYPDLADRVNNREPNAYLVSLYWDSEMFRRSSNTRKKLHSEVDYKHKVIDMFRNADGYFTTEQQKKTANVYRRAIARNGDSISNNAWRNIYDALTAGDPKYRTLRSVYQHIKAEQIRMGGYE